MKTEFSVMGTFAYEAGLAYREGSLKQGDEVCLVPESSNFHDKNAVKVVLKANGRKLGYVPRGLAVQARDFLEKHQDYKGTITHVNLANGRRGEAVYVHIRLSYPKSRSHRNLIEDACRRASGIPGVYLIICRSSKREYVGQSQDIGARWADHVNSLRRHRHHSRKLQDDWNQFGADAFSFEILEQVADRDERESQETWYIKRRRALVKGYNQTDLTESERRALKERKLNYPKEIASEVISIQEQPRAKQPWIDFSSAKIYISKLHKKISDRPAVWILVAFLLFLLFGCA